MLYIVEWIKFLFVAWSDDHSDTYWNTQCLHLSTTHPMLPIYAPHGVNAPRYIFEVGEFKISRLELRDHAIQL